MKLISPPGALLTEVAGQLLESAQALGLAPEVVETTTGAEFGYGFTVPDDVFDHWFLRRGEARNPQPPSEPVVFPEPVAPVVAEPRVPARKSRGVKPVTEGTEA
jgi:hypothetical protein